MALEEALNQAFASRQDYRAAEVRLQAAHASKRAALADNLPSLHLNADYGVIGRTPADTHSTYAVMTQLRIPLFDAATTRGHVLEAEALVQRRTAELNDFRARVEYEVRAAFLDLRAADEQLQAAQDAMNLATQELEQTRDRFAAGVAGEEALHVGCGCVPRRSRVDHRNPAPCAAEPSASAVARPSTW